MLRSLLHRLYSQTLGELWTTREVLESLLLRNEQLAMSCSRFCRRVLNTEAPPVPHPVP